jgi:hypothetical protein
MGSHVEHGYVERLISLGRAWCGRGCVGAQNRRDRPWDQDIAYFPAWHG